jgi:hypothetical protein
MTALIGSFSIIFETVRGAASPSRAAWNRLPSISIKIGVIMNEMFSEVG